MAYHTLSQYWAPHSTIRFLSTSLRIVSYATAVPHIAASKLSTLHRVPCASSVPHTALLHTLRSTAHSTIAVPHNAYHTLAQYPTSRTMHSRSAQRERSWYRTSPSKRVDAYPTLVPDIA
eukprot:444057-Rhodomonas_salina.2